MSDNYTINHKYVQLQSTHLILIKNCSLACENVNKYDSPCPAVCRFQYPDSFGDLQILHSSASVLPSEQEETALAFSCFIYTHVAQKEALI